MDDLDNKRLEDLYKRRKELRDNIDQYSAQLEQGAVGVQIRVDLERFENELRDVERAIQPLEIKKKYPIGQDQSSLEKGREIYRLAVETFVEAQRKALSGESEEYEIEELHEEALKYFNRAVKYGFVDGEIFFLMAQIYDRQEKMYDAFECYTASIMINKSHQGSLYARSALVKMMFKEREPFEFIKSIFSKDNRAIKAINSKDARLFNQSRSCNKNLLREIIARYFSDSELQDLVLELQALDPQIEYENLAGQGKGDKVRELIGYLERRGLIPKLVDKCRVLRPNAEWDTIFTSSNP